jgi:hypothetical protein
MDALLDPIVFFFLLGLLAKLLKSDLKIPESLYESLTIYLLLAIGLKGGVELSKTDFSTVLIPLSGTLLMGGIIPLIAFFIARTIFKYSRNDSAALATHYGSVSAVTFAVCLSYLGRMGIAYDQFATVMLVMLEIPALIIGISLAKIGTQNFKENLSTVLHEVICGKSVFLLVGGLLIGFIVGAERMVPINVVFVSPFKGALAFFLLEMGLVVAGRLKTLKRVGFSLLIFAVLMPLISATLACFIGTVCGLSLGGVIVLATLASSASYIAAPAAVRVGIPEANPALYLTGALAITFPFNVVFGIPIYHQLAIFIQSLIGG